MNTKNNTLEAILLETDSTAEHITIEFASRANDGKPLTTFDARMWLRRELITFVMKIQAMTSETGVK